MRSHLKPAVVRALALCLAVCCLSFHTQPLQARAETPAPRDSRWAVPVEAEGLPNLFRVTPDLYRSAQPDKAGMRRARDMGIKTVLSFRASDKDTKRSKGTGLLIRHVPIDTWDVDDEEIVNALRIIRLAPKPILVHCRHGADRTGLIIAMYRMVFQGWSKEEAKDEMINGGYGFHSIWMNIPEEIDKADIEAVKAGVFTDTPPKGGESS